MCASRWFAAALLAALASSSTAQPPGPPSVDRMAGWMAGTTMCLVVLGANSDGSNAPRPPQGSGFLLNEFGYVLTNSHVVRPQTVESGGYALYVPREIRGTFDADCDQRGPTYVLEVVAFDEYVDLALLKVRQNEDGWRGGWRYLPRRDSNLLQKNQALLAVGFPGGVSKIAPAGQVTALDRARGRLESSLAVDRGFSGGPVLDDRGYVVGVVWGGRPDNGRVNLFIPINHARHLISMGEGERP